MRKERDSEKYAQSPPAGGASPVHWLHTLCLTLLALLLPLAFLLLARLTASPLHLLPSPASTFLRFDLVLLLTLLSGVCVASLLSTFVVGDGGAACRPHTSLAWAFLWVFQLCVGLGIEAGIGVGVGPTGCLGGVGGPCATWAQRAVFFLGVHEATLFWWRMFVRPVVDDAVLGFPSCERCADRVAVGAAFSALWLWTVANEVDGLIATVGFKGGLPVPAGSRWHGFGCWMVSCVTATTGMVRVVKGFWWVAKLAVLRARGWEAAERVNVSDKAADV